MFNGPTLTSKKGRILWTLIVPLYWAIACMFISFLLEDHFLMVPSTVVIGSSVPALGAMTGLIGAVCIFQFT